MNKNKYIGKYVHGGGELNGVIGHIVDVIEDTDATFGDYVWFNVKDEQDGTIHSFTKEELQEITIGIVYKDLD